MNGKTTRDEQGDENFRLYLKEQIEEILQPTIYYDDGATIVDQTLVIPFDFDGDRLPTKLTGPMIRKFGHDKLVCVWDATLAWATIVINSGAGPCSAVAYKITQV